MRRDAASQRAARSRSPRRSSPRSKSSARSARARLLDASTPGAGAVGAAARGCHRRPGRGFARRARPGPPSWRSSGSWRSTAGVRARPPPDAVGRPRLPSLPERAAARRARPFRVLGAKGALMPNSALVHGLQDVRAYDGLGVARLRRVARHGAGLGAGAPAARVARRGLADPRPARRALRPGAPRSRRSTRRMGAVRTAPRRSIATAASCRARSSSTATSSPPATTPAVACATRAWIRAARRCSRPIPRRGSPARAAPRTAVGTARITALRARARRDRHDAPGRRLLVLTDAWFPGWRATVDGVPVADRARQLRLPRRHGPRRHATGWSSTYAPASFRLGATISGAALLLLGLWTVFDERRQRRAPSPPAV